MIDRLIDGHGRVDANSYYGKPRLRIILLQRASATRRRMGAAVECKNESMPQDRYLEDYLHGAEAPRCRYG